MTIRRRLRSWLCLLINGRHELYTERDRRRVYQRCLLCGHETKGWVIGKTYAAADRSGR